MTQPGAALLKANSVTSEVSKRAVHASDGDSQKTQSNFTTSRAAQAKKTKKERKKNQNKILIDKYIE